MRRLIYLAAAGLLLWATHGAWGAANTYVDHTKGGGGDTGADTTNAWVSIEKAVEAIHAAGDTIFVKATHAETLGNDAFVLSDGGPINPIVIMGDDGTIWPSAPSGQPAITCVAEYVSWFTDDYWHIHNMHFKAYSDKAILAQAHGLLITNCTFTEPVAAGDYGIRAYTCAVEDCIFDGNTIGNDGNNNGTGIISIGGRVDVRNCTFDGLDKGLESAGTTGGAVFFATDCEFGETEDNTTDASVDGEEGLIAILGGYLDNNTKLTTTATDPYKAYISRYYLSAAKRPMAYVERYAWTIITDYTTVHSGGGDYSLKIMTPQTMIGSTAPIKLVEMAVYADSAESRNYTLSAYRDSDWGAAPTAAQLYAEVTYWDADSMATSASTAVLTNDSQWYDLTVSGVSPNHDGLVMITLWLKVYDADGAIYVDPRLVATGEKYHETFLWGAPDLAFFYTAGGQVIIISGG